MILDLPCHIVDIRSFKIADPNEEYDWSWIETYGDVILKIKCIDGLFILIRTGYSDHGKMEKEQCQIPNLQ